MANQRERQQFCSGRECNPPQADWELAAYGSPGESGHTDLFRGMGVNFKKESLSKVGESQEQHRMNGLFSNPCGKQRCPSPWSVFGGFTPALPQESRYHKHILPHLLCAVVDESRMMCTQDTLPTMFPAPQPRKNEHMGKK